MISPYIIPGLMEKKIMRQESGIIKTDTDCDQVISDVAIHYNVTVLQLKSKVKTTELVTARQVASVILYKHSALSLKAIGLKFNRDHSTVIHSLARIDDLCSTEPDFKKKFKQIESNIQQKFKFNKVR